MEGQNVIEQEIAQLEARLKEKKASLENGPQSVETTPTDKEIVHQAVGEKIQQQIPQYQPASQKPASQGNQQSYLDPALQEPVQTLVNIAFGQGLEVAIKQAVATGNAALIDAFHDVIADQLYQELLTRNKIKQIN
jgi:hypothetical protein